MKKYKIVPIVEGYGEEAAVPCLIRRWLKHRRYHKSFEVLDAAINAKGCGRLKAAYDRERHIGIEHYIEAALRNSPDAIVVILDSDDDCVKRSQSLGLGPELLTRAKAVDSHLPISVVVANREYEAWFLASLTRIRANGHLPKHSSRFGNYLKPESHRDCKGIISNLLCCPYEETVHQHQLTESLTFSKGAVYRSPSYGKLIRDLDRITREVRQKSKTGRCKQLNGIE